jgi:peptidoglycan hydrolase-like protein with peptidoglycan-binding domain
MTRAQILAAIANIQTAIAGLQQQLAALGGGTTTYSCASITKNLFYGMASDPQVRCLQEFLTAQKYFTVPATGNYFAVTQVAVSRFQEKYAGEILTPFGLKTGTGIVGLKTRQVINRLLGAPSN